MSVVLVRMFDSMSRNPSLGVEGEDEDACEFIILVETEDRFVSA